MILADVLDSILKAVVCRCLILALNIGPFPLLPYYKASCTPISMYLVFPVLTAKEIRSRKWTWLVYVERIQVGYNLKIIKNWKLIAIKRRSQIACSDYEREDLRILKYIASVLLTVVITNCLWNVLCCVFVDYEFHDRLFVMIWVEHSFCFNMIHLRLVFISWFAVF